MNKTEDIFLSVVIPARNEEATIALVLDELLPVIGNLEKPFEVIVVDDGSEDRTKSIAMERGVRVIANPLSPGKGHALIAGFRAARGHYIAMMDADYSHRPEDLPYLLKEMERGVGMVIGSRMLGGSDEYEIVRLFGNVFLNLCFKIMFGCFTTDALNGYKIFRRDVFTESPCTSRGFEIEIELLANALARGYKITEVFSHERRRAGGKMKSKALPDGFRFLWAIVAFGLRHRLRRRRHVREGAAGHAS